MNQNSNAIMYFLPDVVLNNNKSHNQVKYMSYSINS